MTTTCNAYTVVLCVMCHLKCVNMLYCLVIVHTFTLCHVNREPLDALHTYKCTLKTVRQRVKS